MISFEAPTCIISSYHLDVLEFLKKELTAHDVSVSDIVNLDEIMADVEAKMDQLKRMTFETEITKCHEEREKVMFMFNKSVQEQRKVLTRATTTLVEKFAEDKNNSFCSLTSLYDELINMVTVSHFDWFDAEMGGFTEKLNSITKRLCHVHDKYCQDVDSIVQEHAFGPSYRTRCSNDGEKKTPKSEGGSTINEKSSSINDFSQSFASCLEEGRLTAHRCELVSVENIIRSNSDREHLWNRTKVMNIQKFWDVELKKVREG